MTAFHQSQEAGTDGNKVECRLTFQLEPAKKSMFTCGCVCLCQSTEQVKERLWEEHFLEFGRGVHMFRTEKIQRLVAMGMPESLRGELWMALSGKTKTEWLNDRTSLCLRLL